MKTLIITVGTRQVGWKCKDGIVRSLGADGDRGHPKHIDYLYDEFGLERGYHSDEQKPEFRWSVRYLGEMVYQHCKANQDFSSVELLMDGVILSTLIQQDLDHIILWGTDQPEGTPWNFRRADTLWLANLMAGKIRQQYPQIEVDVWNPVVPVNQSDAIRQEVEGFILKYALDRLDPTSSDQFTLAIQTKGSAPQIANALEICAAALMRQCPVEQLIPVEPSPLFEGDTVRIATEFKAVNLGQYFWPVERSRIVSAWERGDFAEAAIWLAAHRDRYEILHKLAKTLSLASNGETKPAFNELRNWCNSKLTHSLIPPEQLKNWQQQLQSLLIKDPSPENQFLLAWEGILLIELAVKRESYTVAFMQFVQLLERLLYIQSKADRWVQKGIIKPNDTYRGKPEDYNAGFGGLLMGWSKVKKYNPQNSWVDLLDAIRELRNEVVHQGKSVNSAEIYTLWKKTNFDATPPILELMMQVLHQVLEKRWNPPFELLLRSLYRWGLDQLMQS
jgi:hypothetical protein